MKASLPDMPYCSPPPKSMVGLCRAPTTTTLPLGSAATARPSSNPAPPSFFDHRCDPIDEYFTRKTSCDGPPVAEILVLVSAAPPKFTVPTKCPVANTLPLGSTATALPRSSFPSPAAASHKNVPRAALPACGTALAVAPVDMLPALSEAHTR